MPEKNPKQKKYPVRNQSGLYKHLKTEKQWLKQGLVPVENAQGTEMYTNGTHHRIARYFAPHEVMYPLATDYSKLKSKLQSAEKKLEEIETVITKVDLPDKTKKKLFYILNQE